ncbi:MAG: AzlC family ABC transporter permease [Oscillospiraceae bacterium]|nr:AzlC family ABC transporter permease [Oscillospiraceae bacterium]
MDLKVKSNSLSFSEGFKDGIPIGLGYLSVSFGFGIMAVSNGLPVLAAVLTSMTNLTSAGQVAGIGIIAAGGTLLEMILAQLIINMRYALMSISLSQKLDGSFTTLHRFLASFGITDEIFAVASGKGREISNKYMYGLILFPFIGWSTGTFLGAIAGEVLPESIKAALGIAIYGMFIAIFIPPARKSVGVLTVVAVSAGLSCCFKYIPVLSGVSGGFVIIICALAASAAGAMLFPVKEEKEDGNDG